MDEIESDPVEEIVERIALDIADLRETLGSDAAADDLLRARFFPGDDGAEPVPPPQPARLARPPRPLGELVIGAGELVFGAILAVGGLILIVPSVLGFSSRGDLAQYVADLALGLSSPGLSDPLVGALGFGIALFLVLASLYTLGHASRSLRASGVVQAQA